MPRIRTVRGDIAPEELGICPCHEHLYVERNSGWGFSPGHRQECMELALPDLEELRRFGCNSFLDAVPIGVGRDVELMKIIAEKTSFNIIASTGFYLDAEVPVEFREKSVAELAAFMRQEIEEGVDDTGIRTGAIKVASDSPVTPLERRIMEAASIVQQDFGVLINTHALCGAQEQLDILLKAGASAQKILFGHADGELSLDFHQSLLDKGASLCFTEFGLEGLKPNPNLAPRPSLKQTAKLVYELVKRGYADRLNLAVDYNYLLNKGKVERCTYGFPGRDYSFLYRKLLPTLKESGVTDEDFRCMMVEVPKRLLAF